MDPQNPNETFFVEGRPGQTEGQIPLSSKPSGKGLFAIFTNTPTKKVGLVILVIIALVAWLARGTSSAKAPADGKLVRVGITVESPTPVKPYKGTTTMTAGWTVFDIEHDETISAAPMQAGVAWERGLNGIAVKRWLADGTVIELYDERNIGIIRTVGYRLCGNQPVREVGLAYFKHKTFDPPPDWYAQALRSTTK